MNMNNNNAWFINKDHKPSLWITTGKAVELIEKYAQKNNSVLDVGCGGGAFRRTRNKRI